MTFYIPANISPEKDLSMPANLNKIHLYLFMLGAIFLLEV